MRATPAPEQPTPMSRKLPRLLCLLALAAGTVTLARSDAAPAPPKPAGDAAAPKAEGPYPGIPANFSPALDEIATLNPRLIPAWREVRDLQAEWKRLFGTFGKQARRDAERGMANIDRALERSMRTFRTEYDRLSVPWTSQEASLREKAVKLSGRPADPSEARQREREAELSKLYMDANAVHERLSALGKLEESITVKTPPTRLDQLGVARATEKMKGLKKPEIDLLLPVHLALRDALADVESLEARKKADEAAWRPADAQQLQSAQRDVDKAMADVEKVLERLKKPTDSKKTQVARALESLNKRIEATQKAKRPTDRLDVQAAELTSELAELEAAMQAYDAFAGYKAFKEKRAAPPPPKP